MNKESCKEETRAEFFSRHVGRTMNVHEEVWNGKASIQGSKEAAGDQGTKDPSGHTTSQQ